jgi:hypothetical protein
MTACNNKGKPTGHPLCLDRKPLSSGGQVTIYSGVERIAAMTMKKTLLYGLLAVLVTVGFWLGGYAYFVGSDDWRVAQETIASSEVLTSKVGKVKGISVSPLGFSYRFSGQWGEAKLRLLVRGDSGESKCKAVLEKSKGKWKLVRIEED